MRVREWEVNLGAISEIESNVGVHGLESDWQRGRRKSGLVLQPEGPFSFSHSVMEANLCYGEQSEERGRIELHLLEGRAYLCMSFEILLQGRLETPFYLLLISDLPVLVSQGLG